MKNKIDSRVRFQNPRFTQKLENARGYKRPARILPKTNRDVFLSRLGLSSWLSRTVTALILLLIIYLVYVPNFLFIKKISVNARNSNTTESVRNITASYLEKRLPWPQKNIILLSKNKLKNYLLSNDQEVFSVNKITKRLPNELIIDVTPRVDTFVLQTASSTDIIVSNDGIATSEIIANASTTLPNLAILIKLDSGEGLNIGHEVLAKTTANFIKKLQAEAPPITGSPISSYEMSSLTATELTAYVQSGFQILFDLNSDLSQTLSRLRVLFSQFADADKKKLYYVDMRFKDKAYVCYKGTPCVKKASPTTADTPTTTAN